MSVFDFLREAMTSVIKSPAPKGAPAHIDNEQPYSYLSSFHTHFLTYEIAYQQYQNPIFRPHMEDAVQVIEDFSPQFPLFIAVFDGHGGAFAMEYCVRYLSKELQQALFETGKPEDAFPLAFERVDKGLMQRQANRVGTTATVCLISTQGVVYTANVGDSSAYLISLTESIALTANHRCDDTAERERLLYPSHSASHVQIIKDRVNGRLMLTRALGDHDLKSSGVLCTPFVSSRYFPNTFALVVASDGVWDYVQAQEITVGSNPKETARLMMEQVKAALSRDNISLAVVNWKSPLPTC